MTQYITEGTKSIFGRLPVPDMVEIEGHVCIPINNIVSNHLAMGIDIEYTLIKHPGHAGGQESKTDWIHGTIRKPRNNSCSAWWPTNQTVIRQQCRDAMLGFCPDRIHFSGVGPNKDSTMCGFTPLHSHRLTDQLSVSTILIVLRSVRVTWITPLWLITTLISTT